MNDYLEFGQTCARIEVGLGLFRPDCHGIAIAHDIGTTALLHDTTMHEQEELPGAGAWHEQHFVIPIDELKSRGIGSPVNDIRLSADHAEILDVHDRIGRHFVFLRFSRTTDTQQQKRHKTKFHHRIDFFGNDSICVRSGNPHTVQNRFLTIPVGGIGHTPLKRHTGNRKPVACRSPAFRLWPAAVKPIPQTHLDVLEIANDRLPAIPLEIGHRSSWFFDRH
jgi:hypothetical protein